MTQNQDEIYREEKLGTNLSVEALEVLAVPTRGRNSANKSEGFIRMKIIKGRAYYYHVKTILVNGKPRQKVVEYFGSILPKGLHLGPVKRKE